MDSDSVSTGIRPARTYDESFSAMTYCWDGPDGEIVLFDAASLSAVRAVADSVDDLLSDPGIHERLEEEGLLSSGTEDDERTVPRYVDRNVTALYVVMNRRCNFDCDYCYLPPQADGDRIDVETAKRATDLLVDATDGHGRLVFFGGEPLLDFDHIEGLVERTPDTCTYSITTNGTLVTEDVATLFDEHDFSVAVSLDGPPEIHNSKRTYCGGSDSYANVTQGIRTLEEQGVSYQLLCTVGEHNIDALPEVIGHLDSEFDHAGISFNHPRFSGRGEQSVGSIPPAQLADAWIELIERYGRGDLPTLPTNIYDRWIRPLTTGDHPPVHCAGCGRHLVVTPDGKLGPCMAADTLENPDDEFWTHVDEVDSFAEVERSELMDRWQETLPRNHPTCRYCPAVSICGGGCPYNAYERTGELDRLDGQYCHFVRETLRRLMARFSERIEPEGPS